jgi:hypothetical protein
MSASSSVNTKVVALLLLLLLLLLIIIIIVILLSWHYSSMRTFVSLMVFSQSAVSLPVFSLFNCAITNNLVTLLNPYCGVCWFHYHMHALLNFLFVIVCKAGFAIKICNWLLQSVCTGPSSYRGHVVAQVVEALRYNDVTLPAALRPCGGRGL